VAPEQIGNYAIDAELGRGAFGVVYRAHHVERTDERVALKVVDGRRNLDRLMLEPALLSQLDHPCIVGIEDYFRDRGRLVLALEFIEGEDLKTMLDRGETFSQAQVRDLLLQMGSALAAAHARNIVHRDIKPSNILVVRDGQRLKFILTDFGIGHQAEGIQDQKRTGGTFLFMAPEQLRGRPGPQSDLWALGVVAYRLLTGRLPFPGPTLPELSQQILYGVPAALSSVCPEPVDPDLEKAILRLLDKSLQERVASADELVRLLGFHGKPAEVLSEVRPRARKAAPSETLDRKLARRIRWRKRLLGFILALYLLPSGPLTAGLLLAALWLFFKLQTDDRWGRGKRVVAGAAALALLAGNMVMGTFVGEWTQLVRLLFGVRQSATAVQAAVEVANRLGLGPDELLFVGPATALLSLALLLLPAVAASAYVGLRRLQREKSLRDATLEGSAGSDRYLETMRSALEYRFADVGFHLKYAEALVARGRHADAAVEARLIVVQDPYNFNGNLLLANTYYTLGLYDDCADVCQRYLAVSGYCFEFAELHEQCEDRSGVS
jgi:hypothetical protein